MADDLNGDGRSPAAVDEDMDGGVDDGSMRPQAANEDEEDDSQRPAQAAQSEPHQQNNNNNGTPENEDDEEDGDGGGAAARRQRPDGEANGAGPMNDDGNEDEAGDDEGRDDADAGGPIKKKRKTKKEIEEEKKERGLGEVLLMMEDYCPVIPDAVTDYYLARAGFECDDIRVKRLLALAAQKFIADIASDAFQHCKIRQQAQQSKDKKTIKRTVLTVDDLSGALAEHGINVKKPEYYN
ncbi:Transcription initiation factor TFIID subunit 10 [Irineochytrium annulatum]|nr:Transcription initiation factor TFIID subunit 10 [Irineochytrium annulatum]